MGVRVGSEFHGFLFVVLLSLNSPLFPALLRGSPSFLTWNRARSPADINARLDHVISDIRRRFHGPALGASSGAAKSCDVLVVAHGLILRAFAARWVGKDVAENPALILETGGVGTLR